MRILRDRWATGYLRAGLVNAMSAARAALLTAGCLAAFAYAGKRVVDLMNPAPAAAAASPASLESRPCRLSIRGSALSPLLFPTLDGAKEYDGAVVARDVAGANKAIRLNLGFAVSPMAACNHIDSAGGFGELSYAKVRVTEGAFAGRVGWLPQSQTLGD